MNVSYGIMSDRGRLEDQFETFAEAVLVAGSDELWPRSGDELWLLLDDVPVLALPHSFNRIVYQGGEELVTSVLGWREVTGQTLPAPTLILDFDNGSTRWSNGQTTRRLYG